MDSGEVASAQLARMRGMTRYYHERFFSDVRVTTFMVLSLFVAAWISDQPEIFLLIPVACLVGANQTAFDASYLIFARTYASRLENDINERLGSDVLLAARMEDAYLFPLGRPKLVTIPLSGQQTWFSWMTAFYTLLGAGAFVSGLMLGWQTLNGHGRIWVAAYSLAIGGLTLFSLGFGMWWFVNGVGEKRLRKILDLD